jgi:hypothetical protein
MEFVISIEVLVGLVFIVMFGSDVLDLDLSRRSYQCLSNPFDDTRARNRDCLMPVNADIKLEDPRP